MHPKELELIQEVMDQLKDEMEYGKDDFADRLGKGKPSGVTVLKIEGKADDPMMERGEEDSGMDVDDDKEMGESPMHAMSMGDEMEVSPEDKLKQRLLRLRG